MFSYNGIIKFKFASTVPEASYIVFIFSASDSGANKFFISCHKYNKNAQKFYEKMGGKIVEIDCDSANNGLPQIKFAYSIY